MYLFHQKKFRQSSADRRKFRNSSDANLRIAFTLYFSNCIHMDYVLHIVKFFYQIKWNLLITWVHFALGFRPCYLNTSCYQNTSSTPPGLLRLQKRTFLKFKYDRECQGHRFVSVWEVKCYLRQKCIYFILEIYILILKILNFISSAPLLG